MEDKYLSKAKRIDNGDWLVGYVVKYGYTGKEKYYIVPSYASDLYAIEVDPSTICRSIGLKDKNGKLIWKNDIVDFLGHKGIIKFECGSFGIGYQKNIENILYACKNDNYISLWEIYWNFNNEDDLIDTVEAIGNIFDNPELNKREKTYCCKDSNDYER